MLEYLRLLKVSAVRRDDREGSQLLDTVYYVCARCRIIIILLNKVIVGSVYNYWIRCSMCVRNIIQYVCANCLHTHTIPVRCDDREGSQFLDTVFYVCANDWISI